MTNPLEAFLFSRLKKIVNFLHVGKILEVPYRIVKYPHTWRYDIDVLLDYIKFKSAIRPAKSPNGQSGSKPLLVVSLSGQIVQAKEESILAKAIEGCGYTSTIVTYRRYKSVLKYHRASGIRNFLFLDDYIPKELPADDIKKLDYLLNKKTVSHVLKYTYRDVSVGKWAMGALTRLDLLTKIDVNDYNIRIKLRASIVDRMKEVVACDCLVDELKPEFSLIPEPLYIGFGPLYETIINRKINSIQWISGHDESKINIQRCNEETRYRNPYSVSGSTWARIKCLHLTDKIDGVVQAIINERYDQNKSLLARRIQHGTSKYDSRQDLLKRLNLDPDKKVAVVFCPLAWDATYFFGEDIFESFEAWLLATVDSAKKNSSVNWIIKFHPGNVYKLKSQRWDGELVEKKVIGKHCSNDIGHVRYLDPETPISTHSLFNITDYCVTIRGSIGIEMAAKGKVVVTAGTGRYDRLGFTYDSDSAAKYQEKLDNLNDIQAPIDNDMIRLAKLYLYTLYRLRPLVIKTFKHTNMSMSLADHPLYHNVSIPMGAMDNFHYNRYIKSFTEWALKSNSSDYLTL